MKDLVEYIVKALCEFPDEVEVKMDNDNGMEIIRISVAASDMGKVIGKNGKIATSIRTIVNSLSSKQHKRYIIKIEEK
jgi:predicted RNA-binding protein YlqC (UPF0109 family)